MLTWKLVFRSLRRDGARTLCALFGISAAVGLLGWNLGLADTAVREAEGKAQACAAPFAAWATGPARGPARPEPKRVDPFRRRPMALTALPADFLAAHPDAVALTVERAQIDARPGGLPLQGPPLMGMAAALPAAGIPFSGQVLTPETPADAPAQVRAATPAAGEPVPALFATCLFGRRVPAPPLGSTMDLILARGTLTLRVAGFFEADGNVKEFPTLYLPEAGMARLRALTPTAARGPNLALLPASPDAAGAEGVRLTVWRDIAERFRSDATNHLMQSLPLSLSLAILTAIVMLVTALCAGLAAERQRLALLRCAGMTRGGVAALVLGETAVLAVAGWLLGLVLALGFLQVFFRLGEAAEVARTVQPGAATLFGTLALALGASVAASLLPMAQAARIRPLEMLPDEANLAEVRRVSPWRTLLGLALFVPMPLLAFLDRPGVAVRTPLLLAIGFPCFLAGLILSVHPMLRLAERVFVRPLGRVLGLSPTLLSRRVSRAPRRALGVVLSITLGLGSYVAIHAWGASLIASYIPSPAWPDVIVSMLPKGLDATTLAAVRTRLCEAPSGTAVCAQTEPVFATQLPLARSLTASITAAGGRVPPGAVILLFGADPAAMFAPGPDSPHPPLMPARWLEGSPEEAARALAERPAAVIPVMLSRLTGLHKGDRLPLEGGLEVEIAGVIDLNWHMVTSRSQVRTRFAPLPEARGPGGAGASGPRPTYGMMFVSAALVRQVEGNPAETHFLWCQFSPALRALYPLDATVRLDAAIRAILAELPSGAALLQGNSIQAHHRDEIADGTLSHGNNILGTMAKIPFWSLIVTCTGIAALAAASRRATQREGAVLRAVGMTRGQLSRLCLGEMVLVILVTLVLSLFGGLLLGWSFTGITRENLNAGLAVRFVIPWLDVARGFVMAAGLSLLMAALSAFGIRPSR